MTHKSQVDFVFSLFLFFTCELWKRIKSTRKKKAARRFFTDYSKNFKIKLEMSMLMSIVVSHQKANDNNILDSKQS